MRNSLLKPARVLMTRPQHQAENLTKLLTATAVEVVLFPTIEITPICDRSLLINRFKELNHYHVVIFVSANAVTYSSDLLVKHWSKSNIHTQFAAIGPATATALAKLGIPVTITPDYVYNSEALLALPELQQSVNKQILIISGADGKEVLATTLRQRGAHVTTAVAYQRVLPQIDAKPLLNTWQRDGIHIIICTSKHSLKNLSILLHNATDLLLKTPLIVISRDMLAYAIELGWRTKPIVAENATDEAILTAFKLWRQQNNDI